MIGPERFGFAKPGVRRVEITQRPQDRRVQRIPVRANRNGIVGEVALLLEELPRGPGTAMVEQVACVEPGRLRMPRLLAPGRGAVEPGTSGGAAEGNVAAATCGSCLFPAETTNRATRPAAGSTVACISSPAVSVRRIVGSICT